MLKEILHKRSVIAIGLNSGTSFDGLDLAAVKIEFRAGSLKASFIRGEMIAYPKTLYNDLTAVFHGETSTIESVMKLDRRLGCFYGDQAKRFCDSLRRMNLKPDLVATHGQTIKHLPDGVRIGRKKESATFQIGHPESIANRTSLLTIARFRQADIASGGEGAPITGAAMWHFFNSRHEDRLIINIGGIANYFFIPRNSSPEKMSAADCGPGNSIIDLIARERFGKKFDRNGKLAAAGHISGRLLSILLADRFLRGKYGPSTGRERFGIEFVNKTLKAASVLNLSSYDVMATVTELTAAAISDSVRPIFNKYHLKKAYVFGGGSHNTYMVDRIRARLFGIQTLSTEELSINPDYLEAGCYAVMGAMVVRSLPTGLPQVTGARGRTIGGCIIEP
jgi:anhydro-N-acetylmuramic acid kinase